jgi:hypothetical protein
MNRNLISKFMAINKWIRYLLLIALADILVMELLFRRYENGTEALAIISNIFLKISYSYVASFIFYFVAIHLDKERKRLSIFRIIHKKTHRINKEIADIFNVILTASNINDGYDETTNFEVIQKALAVVNVKNKITADHYEFNNIYLFLAYKGNRIKVLVNELLQFVDYLDSGYLRYLIFIDDLITDKHVFSGFPKADTLNLEYAANTFQQLHENSIELKNTYHKAYARFNEEYKQMKSKNSQEKDDISRP